MANGTFDEGANALLRGEIALLTDTIKIQLIDTNDWTPNFVTDTHFDDVPAPARIGSPVILASKTVSARKFDAADPVFSAVTGDQFEGFVVYKDSGVESTSPLIVFYDTGITGSPLTPNGDDVTVRFNSNGLLAL